MSMSPQATFHREHPPLEQARLPWRFAGIRGRSRSAGTDPISDAILASAERARRLGDTVPLRRDDDYWLAQKGRLLLSAIAGGLSLWTMALFLLALE